MPGIISETKDLQKWPVLIANSILGGLVWASVTDVLNDIMITLISMLENKLDHLDLTNYIYGHQYMKLYVIKP